MYLFRLLLCESSTLLRNALWGWRSDSMVKNTCCSCRSLETDSQNPGGSSQLYSLIPILEDPVFSSDLLRNQVHSLTDLRNKYKSNKNVLWTEKDFPSSAASFHLHPHFRFIFYYMDECFACAYICGACLVFKEARRGRQILRNRSYSWLWASICAGNPTGVLYKNSKCLSHWAVSPASPPLPSVTLTLPHFSSALRHSGEWAIHIISTSGPK